ncbi:hypothetical protein ACHHYP_06233 [Achlya hypogyna]|uniref:Uncharacterized protein n=1 Tax=Achlya hypogyna TaxID=1202772 RepID=A0A1V9YUV0_ACHHY|nr:hypothetical protein ACHHYP_06233 [Achlya hypogyna]
MSVLAVADAVEGVAAFVSCPYALLQLLSLVPAMALSRPYQCFLRLASMVSVVHLWPALRYSALATPEAFVLGMVWLKRVHVFRLDMWPLPEHAVVLARLPMTVVVSVAASIELATPWTGQHIRECTLNVRRGDKETQLQQVTRWLSKAPLQRLHLSYDSAVATPAAEELLQAVFRHPHLEAVHIDVFWLDTVPRSVLDRLILWLATAKVRSVGLSNLRGSSGVARALHNAAHVRAVSLAQMERVSAAYFEQPLPAQLRRLCLTARRLPYSSRLAVALSGACLTHLTLRVEDGDLREVASVLPTLLQLEHLHIKFRAFTPDVALAVASALPQLPQLISVKFDCWPGFLDQVLYVPLASVLPQCQRLQRLALRDVRWNAEGVEAWTDAVAASSNLNNFCVQRGKFPDKFCGFGAASWVGVCCGQIGGSCNLVDVEWNPPPSPKKPKLLPFL